jgi:acetyl-CoA C-acetyltransferase
MTDPRDVVILGAARTAIGKFQGTLAGTPAPRLGAVAIRAAVERAGVEPAATDEVLMGCVVQAGLGQAPARQAAIFAGIPDTVGATTINKVCGSGLKAVMLAAAMIRAGDGEQYIAGGMESMNRAPYLLHDARFGYRLGDGALKDGLIEDGLWCAFENQHMGNAAEWVARRYGLTRAELDQYAYESQMKAMNAIRAGAFGAEIAPVEIPQRKGSPQLFAVDEAPRPDTTLEALAKLKPAFQADGMVTAGNAPGITDGAAAVVVTSRARAQALGRAALARVAGYAQAAVKPLEIFTAPAFAIRRLLAETKTTLADYDLFEINEAFAAQVLANGRELGLDWSKVNVNGGAIALGHPIGASGARCLVTLIHALRSRGLRRGIAALCLGGGEAVALSVEIE